MSKLLQIEFLLVVKRLSEILGRSIIRFKSPYRGKVSKLQQAGQIWHGYNNNYTGVSIYPRL